MDSYSKFTSVLNDFQPDVTLVLAPLRSRHIKKSQRDDGYPIRNFPNTSQICFDPPTSLQVASFAI